MPKTGRIYGYARISTPKQNLERQRRNIRDYEPTAILVEDTYTGTKMNRPKWQQLFQALKNGDCVIFDSVSRMSRNAEEGFATYKELYERGVDLVFLKEHHIDTKTYKQAANHAVPMTGTAVDYILEGVNRYLLVLAEEQIRLAFLQSEKEVTDMRQRTVEGLETARLAGKQIGQKRGNHLLAAKEEPILRLIESHSRAFDGTLRDREVLAFLAGSTITVTRTGKQPEVRSAKISQRTYLKYKRKLRILRWEQQELACDCSDGEGAPEPPPFVE